MASVRLCGGLEGFALVHELEELAVLGGAVAHDLVEVGVGREDAAAAAGLDALGGDVWEFALRECPLGVGLGYLDFSGSADVSGDALDLVALQAPSTPEAERDQAGDLFFEITLRLTALEDAVEVSLPVVE